MLVSVSQAHELVLSCHDDYHRVDVREWTRTESRVSAGPSTAAARNHGGGGPTTCTTHGELVQGAREPGKAVLVVSHGRSTPLVDLADRHESDASRNGGR